MPRRTRSKAKATAAVDKENEGATNVVAPNEVARVDAVKDDELHASTDNSVEEYTQEDPSAGAGAGVDETTTDEQSSAEEEEIEIERLEGECDSSPNGDVSGTEVDEDEVNKDEMESESSSDILQTSAHDQQISSEEDEDEKSEQEEGEEADEQQQQEKEETISSETKAANPESETRTETEIVEPTDTTTQVDDSVLQAVLRAIQMHSTDLALLREACVALWSLALEDDTASRGDDGHHMHASDMLTATNSSTLQTLLGVLWSSQQDAKVVVNCCGALSVLASNSLHQPHLADVCILADDVEEKQEPEKRYLEDVLFSVMIRHERDGNIQTKCCNTLWNLVRPLSPDTNNADAIQASAAFVDRMMNKGLAGIVLDTCTALPTDWSALAAACGAVSCLALDKSGRKHLMEHGASGVLSQVLRATLEATAPIDDVEVAPKPQSKKKQPNKKKQNRPTSPPKSPPQPVTTPAQRQVQHAACAAAWNLALADEYRGVVLDSCAASVLQLMEQSLGSGPAEVQLQGLGLLWNLACSSDGTHATQLVKLGLIDRVVQAMDYYAASNAGTESESSSPFVMVAKEIQVKACGVFLNICSHEQPSTPDVAQSPTSRARSHSSASSTGSVSVALVSHGAIRRVLTAMARYPNEVDIQRIGSGVLLNLGASRALLPRHRASLIHLGALDALCFVVSAHSTNVNLLYKACGALVNLTLNSPRAGAGEARAAVEHLVGLRLSPPAGAPRSTAGFPALLEYIMRLHESDAHLQGQACSLIWNMSTVITLGNDEEEEEEEETANFKKKTGVAKKKDGSGALLGAVARALAAHTDDTSVVGRAMGALVALTASDNGARQHVVSNLDVAQVVVGKVMKAHVSNVRVQREALSLLWSLSAVARNREILAELQAHKAVLLALKVHIEDAQIVDSALGVLWNLAVDEEHKRVLLKDGAGDLVVRAMKMPQHASRVELNRKACSVVWNLSTASTSAQAKLVKLGAHVAVLEAMKRHPDDVQVQRKGCGALWNLGQDVGNRKSLVSSGARASVADAMGKHATDASLQKSGMRALVMLSEAKKKDNVVAYAA